MLRSDYGEKSLGFEAQQLLFTALFGPKGL